jgi:hypothetical protein
MFEQFIGTKPVEERQVRCCFLSNSRAYIAGLGDSLQVDSSRAASPIPPTSNVR